MQSIIVVNYPNRWPLSIEGVEVVSARDYLTNATYSDPRHLKVFNLCRSYRYQSIGYYVSLLAEARGHKPIPSVATMQDMKSQSLIRIASEEIDALIQKSLSPISSDKFILSVYFGKNMAKRYDRLASKLFNAFHTPFLRATFIKGKKWSLQNISPIAGADIPETHRPFVLDAAASYFIHPVKGGALRRQARYDLALLVDKDEVSPPSNRKALNRFVKEAGKVGFAVYEVGKGDYGRIGEYDALFIRTTTSVDHYTYRFARKAEAEGLAVMDDPLSILRCSNKVFLAELLSKKKVPIPETLIIQRDNVERIVQQLGFPVILKKPDGSFSQGVIKAENKVELDAALETLFTTSELVIAQRFTPTQFDWRVGVLDGEPLYACRYHMAKGHWQIINATGGKEREGAAETIAIEDAPPLVIRTALRATKLIGNGLYGVDLKELDGKVIVIEVNDNPNIDVGVEDLVIGDQLYRALAESFARRVEQIRTKGGQGRG